jgi:drug/metabolite transporter (DMT)-like permease
MSIVAPITAVVAAVVPVLFGFARGERPGAAALTGVALALIAVALVSSSSDEDVSGEAEPGRRGIVEALAAGLGFGLLYVVLSETTRGMWPLVAARVVSTAIALAIAALSGGVRLRAGRPLRTMALSGVFDMLGNVFYLTALRQTLIIVAAVITSLYPASTVVLARAVLREQLTMAQWCGVACAGLGVVLIALG